MFRQLSLSSRSYRFSIQKVLTKKNFRVFFATRRVLVFSKTTQIFKRSYSRSSGLDDSGPDLNHGYDYDLLVIGGGSGGLSCSKEAVKYIKKVGVLDFVTPSPQGTSWGLGGTCVNVGCIPKKLMHQASLLGKLIKDSTEYGWNVPTETKHDWNKMVDGVQDYIHSLNFGYRVQLRDKTVEYINAYAKFIDPHTIIATDRKGTQTKLSARRFVICTGGRPKYPEIPGAKEYGISSDDIFSLAKPPGKTLVVGASYVALECAGFLAGLGYDTTVMVRSILLRGFDQQMSELIGEYMKNHGTKFIRPATPTEVTKLDSGKLLVKYFREDDKLIHSEEYDTVLFAIGRDPETHKIGLETTGVKLASNGKILINNEQTSVPHIYAIGDVTQNPGGELTPVAIQAGRYLAKRLFGKQPNLYMDYTNVPTTVFTPLEYGACGLSEEQAIQKYGESNIEVYHTNFKPLEWTVSHGEDNACYAKLVCLIPEREKVLGFHILGPNAGEVTQGFALGIKLGATKLDFDSTIGIHPTVAEEITGMDKTKRSGESPLKTGC